MFKSISTRRLRLNAFHTVALWAICVTAGVGLYRVIGLNSASGEVKRDVATGFNESAPGLKHIRDKGREQVGVALGLQAATGAIWIASLMLGSVLAGSKTVYWRKRKSVLRSTKASASVPSTDDSPTDVEIFRADGEQAAGATHAVVGGRRGRISPAALY